MDVSFGMNQPEEYAPEAEAGYFVFSIELIVSLLHIFFFIVIWYVIYGEDFLQCMKKVGVSYEYNLVATNSICCLGKAKKNKELW